jgi:hypothetical protein
MARSTAPDDSGTTQRGEKEMEAPPMSPRCDWPRLRRTYRQRFCRGVRPGITNTDRVLGAIWLSRGISHETPAADRNLTTRVGVRPTMRRRPARHRKANDASGGVRSLAVPVSRSPEARAAKWTARVPGVEAGAGVALSMTPESQRVRKSLRSRYQLSSRCRTAAGHSGF